jgi:hypothetical protein
LKFLRATLTIATMVATGIIAAGPYTGAGAGDSNLVLLGQDNQLRHGPTRFELHGQQVHGLYPGAVREMRMVLTNPYGFRLRLWDISGVISRSSRRGCPATSTSLRVTGYTGRLPVFVGPHSSATLPGSVPLAMPRTAPQRCAGSHFTIALTGMAARVGR